MRKPAEVFLCKNMKDTVLFIDGENFIHKLKDVITERKLDIDSLDIAQIDFASLFASPLQGFIPKRKIFYAAKLRHHQETKKKSAELVKFQRKLRNTLIKQGFAFVIAGNVRAQKVENKLVFKEKGVDVKIAVDMVSLACEGELQVAIICSSDSDLQPAIKEAKKRGVEVVYLGFELQPNKGLTATTNRTVLFRNAEVARVISGE